MFRQLKESIRTLEKKKGRQLRLRRTYNQLLKGGADGSSSNNPTHVVYDQTQPRKFEGNQTITRVIIPPEVKSIGELAFQKCSGLTEISFPEGLTSIGRAAFLRCRRSPR